MLIHKETVKEFGSVLIRLDEASIIGGIATYFVQNFVLWASFIAFGGGLVLLFSGLYFINKSNLKEK
ncbi:MAG: hypothetical protein ACE5IW_12140 [bacterium]